MRESHSRRSPATRGGRSSGDERRESEGRMERREEDERERKRGFIMPSIRAGSPNRMQPR